MPLDLLDPIAPPAPAPVPVPLDLLDPIAPPAPAPVPVPEFPPIPATNPTVTPAVPAATYDQWFMTSVSIADQGGGKIDLNTYWIEGNATALGTVTTNYIVRDLLSQESLIANPEIAEIAPQFMAALAAVGKRLGVL